MSPENHIHVSQSNTNEITIYSKPKGEDVYKVRKFDDKEAAMDSLNKEKQRQRDVSTLDFLISRGVFVYSLYIGFGDHNPWSIPGVIVAGGIAHIRERSRSQETLLKEEIQEVSKFDPHK